LYFKDDDDEQFVNVVSVSFSAFDDDRPYFNKKSSRTGVRFKYIGLKKKDPDSSIGFRIKESEDLENEFADCLWECIESFKGERLIKSLNVLESDPIFKSSNIVDILVRDSNEKEFKDYSKTVFKTLSSGHKIILLSIARLIETVQEKSLVFIDEPEAHLHPPLLSAFIRTLSELLIDMNGVAIIATHSPVILQEVPQNCVYKLERSGTVFNAERPEIETFGENVGTLTREIFGLEVTDSGFYQILKKSVLISNSYEDLMESFKGSLGSEARSIARALFTHKMGNTR